MTFDGHICPLPVRGVLRSGQAGKKRRPPQGYVWRCECGQQWQYVDDHWRMIGDG